MKKGKVFGKAQIALVLMVLALGTAVWLNMHYSSKKYLGEASYVSKTTSNNAVQTAAKVQKDAFSEARDSRQKSYETASELVQDTLGKAELTDEQKTDAVKRVSQMAGRIEKENNVETLLKAKGFADAVAVIGDNSVSIVVRSDGLTTAQTMQIQDIVVAETEIPLGNIKIIAVK